MRTGKINKPLGEAVCSCAADGRIDLYDPDAYMRALRKAWQAGKRREKAKEEGPHERGDGVHHGV